MAPEPALSAVCVVAPCGHFLLEDVARSRVRVRVSHVKLWWTGSCQLVESPVIVGVSLSIGQSDCVCLERRSQAGLQMYCSLCVYDYESFETLQGRGPTPKHLPKGTGRRAAACLWPRGWVPSAEQKISHL